MPAAPVRTMTVLRLSSLFLLAFLTPLGPVVAEPISTVRVASGLSRPVFVTSPPGDADRLFIVEQHSGRIKILDRDTGLINAAPFLTVGGLSTRNEQGLLGLAFDPDYANNGLFYVNFTASDRATNIRRYQVSGNPDLADPGSATTVLRYSQPQSNHNGGWLGFGPDEYLYISSGDGGSGNDSGSGHTAGTGNSQDITNNLLGKMLRIDTGGDDFPGDPDRNYAIPVTNPFVGAAGDDEIWAFGLRNPWRASFDRATGDLYIADVGQNAREEIDFQEAASTGGENYGWRLREGTIATPTGGVGGPPPTGAVDPIHEYLRVGAPNGGYSVTGGYVYRGPIGELQGHYFFADYVTEQIWSFRYDGANLADFTNWTAEFVPDVGTIDSISSFGEDALGNLYIVDLGGEVFQVGPQPSPGDTDDDGDVDFTDFNTLANNYTGTGGSGKFWIDGDFDGDGDVDFTDFNNLANNYTGTGKGALIPEPSTFALLSIGAVVLLLYAGTSKRGSSRSKDRLD